VDVRLGLPIALVSAASFALSGPLARGLIDVGWSPGAVVLARIAVAALVVAPLAARALRGRWELLRRNMRVVLVYGVVPVAGTQFAYFSAVAAMDVGPALLIEYTAPAAIVVWLWLRHGERPRPLTLVGAGLAAAGLVLVLDLLSGADLALDGVLWALAAMVGAAMYFVMSADTRSGLPPLALAGGGLAVGAVGLGALGVAGVLPMDATTAAPTYGGESVAWWLPFVGLGVVTAAIAYTTGIAASRRLGSRLASFVALTEVVAAVIFAWLLLDQLPGALQLVGGAFIVAGVVVVKLGERPPRAASYSSGGSASPGGGSEPPSGGPEPPGASSGSAASGSAGSDSSVLTSHSVSADSSSSSRGGSGAVASRSSRLPS
jgi:drug/metabolite transporter (DMT)-like permease